MGWFMRSENWSDRRKTSRSRGQNNLNQLMTPSPGNRTRETLVGDKCSHHCAITCFFSLSHSRCQMRARSSRQTTILYSLPRNAFVACILHDLLPPQRDRNGLRSREHNFILPRVNTERYKNIFINRCLFNFI